ncbi:hypothetical protein IWX49DRAFT_7174 [Phyllosticta citricarpa]|uniref:Endoplasmic reticulum junction formation protein lunapark n=2 Tax=Phyllosticta TaxID=121621 RepID=A0ABR1MQF5_9PEZI
MVSLWPWRDDTSAAAFEKTLATLSTKIQKTTVRNDALRVRARKFRVMWTLYSGFLYILVSVIMILVTGWRNWGPLEYTAVAGGPLVIYGVRQGFNAYYEYRISNTQAYLDRLCKERDDTIEKLKEATKYNSTQQLLEKYGSIKKDPTPAAAQRKPSGDQRPSSAGNLQGRTTGAPPPTANIPRNNLSSAPNPDNRPHTSAELQKPLPPFPQGELQNPLASGHQSPPQPPAALNADFAPNAYPAQYAPEIREPAWYDRILDALMGEDETQPKNRFALICTHCRLVNGQAPPGTKSLEDVGKWKCMGCGGSNGHESETQKLVNRLSQVASEQPENPLTPVREKVPVGAVSPEDPPSADATDDSIPARSTRSRTARKKS